MKKQINIKENGKWKATVNIDEDGRVVKEWGKGEQIDKVLIVNKLSREQLLKQKAELQEMIDNFSDEDLEEGVPQPTVEELQNEINEIDKLL